jgi:hypothetical protein
LSSARITCDKQGSGVGFQRHNFKLGLHVDSFRLVVLTKKKIRRAAGKRLLALVANAPMASSTATSDESTPQQSPF